METLEDLKGDYLIDYPDYDERIERVYLNLDGLQGTGTATLREVARALRELRDSGKQVVAFGHAYSQGNYLPSQEVARLCNDEGCGLTAALGQRVARIYL